MVNGRGLGPNGGFWESPGESIATPIQSGHPAKMQKMLVETSHLPMILKAFDLLFALSLAFHSWWLLCLQLRR